jgi:hypothetical protein
MTRMDAAAGVPLSTLRSHPVPRTMTVPAVYRHYSRCSRRLKLARQIQLMIHVIIPIVVLQTKICD